MSNLYFIDYLNIIQDSTNVDDSSLENIHNLNENDKLKL